MPGLSQTVRGADEVAGQAMRFSSPDQVEEHVLVNGAAGVLVARGRRVLSLTAFTIVGGRIAAMDILADPERLGSLDVSAEGP
jgi:RNA polymerase sigma-70 factor (ECF subfamily)